MKTKQETSKAGGQHIGRSSKKAPEHGIHANRAKPSRISSKEAGWSSRIVARAPGGQGAQDNSQSQAAKTEGERQNKTEAGKEGSNVREEASIPANGKQDKVNHPFHLQGVLKPLRAILSEAGPNHLGQS